MDQDQHTGNPFPGIRSFEPEEAHLFFGRETQINELIHRLDRTRFLAVVGTSGCGKSSLVRAGLLPRLSKGHQGPGGTEWRTILFRPGDDPFGNLAQAFCGKDEVTGQSTNMSRSEEEIDKMLRSGEEGLTELVRAENPENLNLVLVVDQFEELFRIHNLEAEETLNREAHRFVKALLHAINQSEVPICLALTMRSDFLGNCTEFHGLTEAINEGQYLIPRMTYDERRLAIEGPIGIGKGQITERLVERILKDAGEDQDQLPIMQHALMRMWDYWKNSRIGDQPMDFHEYEAIGTLKNALSLHAEEAFEELEDERQQHISEVLFKALTDLGTDNRGTRRPTPVWEICQLAEASEEEVTEVVDVFRANGRAFLMPPSKMSITPDSVLDISHESLMRKWTRLRRWVDEEIKSAELYLRLCESSALYQEGKTGLWGNPELQLALNWRKKNHPNLTWAGRYNLHFERAMNFLDHSKKEYDVAMAKREARQKYELRRAKRTTVILGGASLISLLFLLVAFNLRYKAEDSEREALKQKELALAESREAREQKKQAIAQKKISRQQQEIAQQQRQVADEQRVIAQQQTVIAEEQRAVANVQRNKAVEQEKVAVEARDQAEIERQNALEQKKKADEARERAEESEANSKRLRLLAVARNIAIQSSNLNQAEDAELRQLLAAQAYRFNKENQGPVREPNIYNALSGATNDEVNLRGHLDGVRAVTFDARSGKLFSGSEDGEVRQWNSGNGESTVLKTPKGEGQAIRSLTAQSGRLLAGTFGGKLYWWDLKTPGTAQSMELATGIITQLIAHPSKDETFASTSGGQLLRIKGAPDAAPEELMKFNSGINSMEASADGFFLAVGLEDGKVNVVGPTNQPFKELKSYEMGTPVKAVSISPSGRYVAAGGKDGRIRVWNFKAPSNKLIELPGHNSQVVALRFDPENETLVSVSLDGTVKVWTFLDPGISPIVIDRHDSWVWDVAFSNDGKKFATGSQDKTVRLWSTDLEEMFNRVCGTINRDLTQDEWNQYIGEDIPRESSCSGQDMGTNE